MNVLAKIQMEHTYINLVFNLNKFFLYFGDESLELLSSDDLMKIFIFVKLTQGRDVFLFIYCHHFFFFLKLPGSFYLKANS